MEEESISATTSDFQLDEETGQYKSARRGKRDHWWNDHIEDHKVHKDESNDGIYHGRRSFGNGRGCCVPAEIMRKTEIIWK